MGFLYISNTFSAEFSMLREDMTCTWADDTLGNQVRQRAHDGSKISKKKFVTRSQWESTQAMLLKKSCTAKLLKKLLRVKSALHMSHC